MKPNNIQKKQKFKKKPIEKSKKKHVLVIAQEFKFARLLSGNEKKTRDRVLKALKKWLTNCFEKGYEFKEDDFIRVWKGLFYAMWMSDKPLIQEELSENIAGILDLFPKEQFKNAVLMTKAGLKVLATEWYGIDQHRMDKFMMLVRRYLRGSLRCLLRCSWSLKSCNTYTKMLTASDGILALTTPSYARNAMSMILHFIDCFLEELAKVTEGKIPDESLVCLLRPFTTLVCGGEALALCVAARRLLTALLRQSELGLQYSDAERAWQKMGCPPGGPEALELETEGAEIDDEQNDTEDTEIVSALDPRAGRVDVVLPLLPVPAALLADDMRRVMEATACASRAYKRAKICLQRFEELGKDVYPLRVKDTDFLAESEPLPKPEQVAQRLRALEKRLVTSADELALRGLSRKHRKRLLAKSRAGLSIVQDVTLPAAEVPAESTNGDWQIEEAVTDNKQKKSKQDTSNKENQTSNKKKSNKKRKLEERANVVQKSKKAKILKHELQQDTQKHTTVQIVNKLKLNNTETNHGNVNKVRHEKNVDKKEKSKDSNKKTAAAEEKDALVNKGNNENLTNGIESENLKSDANKVKSAGKPTKALTVVVNKIKNNNSIGSPKHSKKVASPRLSLDTPKKVKFVLKNNGAQGPIDYYKSVRQSPNIPFDSSKLPSKTNLKPSMPSPINPFFKKKLKLKNNKPGNKKRPQI